MDLEITTAAGDFQADDEGSIPFTRSNVFKDLARQHQNELIMSGCCAADEASATSLHGSISCVSFLYFSWHLAHASIGNSARICDIARQREAVGHFAESAIGLLTTLRGGWMTRIP